MSFTPMTDEQIAHEEAMDEFARELEKTWVNPRLSTEELKEVFPEILEIAPQRVKALEFWIEKLKTHYAQNPVLGDTLEAIWEREEREEELTKLKRQLVRFKRFIPQGESTLGVTEAQIQDAREVPILDLIDEPRRSGNMYTVLCPLHEERTPSCKIYVRSNDFWCFGCNKGGDTIDLIMARDEVDFVTAVRQLTGVSNESIIS